MYITSRAVQLAHRNRWLSVCSSIGQNMALERMDIDTPKVDAVADESGLFLARSPRLPLDTRLPRRNSRWQVLMNQDGIAFFWEHCYDIYWYWIRLLSNTSLPNDISSSDRRVMDVFRTIEAEIQSDRHRVRLACVRLCQILPRLREVIRKDREGGTLTSRRGRGNASVAIDLHRESLSTTDRHIRRRRRIARRWSLLAGNSPLFLVAYSDRAENIVYAF